MATASFRARTPGASTRARVGAHAKSLICAVINLLKTRERNHDAADDDSERPFLPARPTRALIILGVVAETTHVPCSLSLMHLHSCRAVAGC